MYKVYTGLDQHTLLTSFVRWQMSRIASYSVPVPPPHSLSAAPDILFLATERAFPVAVARVWNRLPDPVTSVTSGAVCWSQLKNRLFNISYPFPVIVQCISSDSISLDTIIVLTYLLRVPARGNMTVSNVFEHNHKWKYVGH